MKHHNMTLGFRLLIAVLIGQALVPQLCGAYTLNSSQLFHRCYSQITQKFLTPEHPLFQLVAKDELSPVEACMTILKKAQFIGRSQFYRMASDDAESKAVLGNFYELHSSWLRNKNWDVRGQAWISEAMSDIFEPTSHALFFTKALFDPQEAFSSIVLSDDFYVPLRDEYDPPNGNITKVSKENFTGVGGKFRFAGRGGIIGIENLKGETFNTSQGDLLWGRSLGGGMVGTHTYITMNAQPRSLKDLPLDGIHVNRLWAQSLYSDLFCRSLPVVRTEDAVPFLVDQGDASFRFSPSCVRCHASIDRTAGLIRSMDFQNFGAFYPPALVGIFSIPRPVTQASEIGWPSVKDSNYSSRPPTGTFYMRDYKGELLSYFATDLQDLGRYLSTLDDLYICAASRYYKYFTGIEVDIGDPQRLNLSRQETMHRNFVIKLGIHLKESQNSMNLIEEILKSRLYRQADFGISGVPESFNTK